MNWATRRHGAETRARKPATTASLEMVRHMENLLLEAESNMLRCWAGAQAADGVPMEIKDKVNVKKLWKACRKDDDTVAASGMSDLTEFDKGLPERTRKSCEQLFVNKHGYALARWHMVA